jgi:hypothetical protein
LFKTLLHRALTGILSGAKSAGHQVPAQHRCPRLASTDNARPPTISVYSFALRPEEHQPSGVLNFTNITNAQLVFSQYDNNSVSSSVPQSALTFDIYAVNYNILKVTSGMGGLVYSK